MDIQEITSEDLDILPKTNHMSDNLTMLVDPYGYYFKEEFEEENPEESLDDDHVDLNIESFKIELKHQFADAKKTRKDFILSAMKSDPAFMLESVNQYYKKLFPSEMFNGMDADQIREVISIVDPVTWGELNLLQKHGGWKPRNSRTGTPYQAQLIRCKSKRMVVRAGRRIGKTAALVVRLLHKAFTWNSQIAGKPVFNIVIFTPNQSQIKLIFKMIEIFIDGNPKLISMIGEGKTLGKIPTRQQPHYTLELSNGVTFNGFVSGSTAIRGQAADILVLDEASFLTPEDTDAVLALINEHKDVELFISSTPKGLKDYFYERVHDPYFVSFYFPSDKYHPKWNKKMEDEFRSQLTEAGFNHEVLANFSGDGEGVFQIPFVDAAYNEIYSLEDCLYNPEEEIYGIGVDWNDPKNGTQIKVIGYNKPRNKFRIVDTASVHIEKWTQTAAVHKVKEMNRKWKPHFIYVDQGHGGTQVENLHEIGYKSPANSIDRQLTKVKGIRFKSVIEVYDPWTKKKVRKETKPFMVNNAVRVFEDFLIELPQEAQNLKKQLEGYIVDRITPSGMPVYAADPKAGDHELDATMLALFGFVMELSSLGKMIFREKVNVVDKNLFITDIGKSSTGIPEIDRQIQLATQQAKQLQRHKAKEVEEVKNAGGITMPFTTKPILNSTAIPLDVALSHVFTAQNNMFQRKHTKSPSRGLLRNTNSKIKSRRNF